MGLAIEDDGRQEIIDGFRRLSQLRPQLQIAQVGHVIGSDIVQGMQQELAAQKWSDLLDKGFVDAGNNWGDLVSGALQKQVEQEISDLSHQIEAETEAGASEAVINGLKTALAEKTAELIDIGKLTATPLVQGISQEVAAKAGNAIISGLWSDVLSDPAAIASGQKLKDLQAENIKLREQQQIAADLGLTDQFNAYSEALRQNTLEIGFVTQAMQTGVGAIGDAAQLTADDIDKITAAINGADDAGASMVNDVITSVEDGRLPLEKAAKLFTKPMIDALEVDLHNAWAEYSKDLLDGTDPTQAAENIKVILELLDQLGIKSNAAGTAVSTLGAGTITGGKRGGSGSGSSRSSSSSVSTLSDAVSIPSDQFVGDYGTSNGRGGQVTNVFVGNEQLTRHVARGWWAQTNIGLGTVPG